MLGLDGQALEHMYISWYIQHWGQQLALEVGHEPRDLLALHGYQPHEAIDISHMTEYAKGAYALSKPIEESDDLPGNHQVWDVRHAEHSDLAICWVFTRGVDFNQ